MNNTSLNEKFAEARLCVLGEKAISGGIGRLSERSLHRILKYTLEPDETKHEIPYMGFVADVMNGDGITEIQTKQLKNLKEKLSAFLVESRVTVVLPLYKNKYIRTVDNDTGELSSPKLSPHHRTVADSAYELYNIREFLSRDNLSVKLVFLTVEEYRRRGVKVKVAGRIRNTERLECIPIRIDEVVDFSSREDYLSLLPKEIPERFCAADINAAYGKGFKRGFSIIKILSALGLLTDPVREGRRLMYSIKENANNY